MKTLNNAHLLGRFKSQTDISKAFGISRAAVSKWFKRGAIPPLRVREYCKKAGIKPAVANSKVFS